jgi:hypothetical protein
VTINYLLPLNGVIRSALKTVFAVAVLITGASGMNGCGLTPVIDSKYWVTAIPFAAAPLSSNLTDPAILGLINLTAPPEYSKTTSVKEQFVQLSPSSACVPPITVPSVNVGLAKPGILGVKSPTFIADWANDGCATIDAWLPDRSSDALIIPAINDPTAVVILDISPPSVSYSRCEVWKYHYGKPPEQKVGKFLPL